MKPPPPSASPIVDTSFEEVHDARVLALLARLSAHAIEPDLVAGALKDLIDIAEASHYGEEQVG